jgi:hypothetical protein
MRMRRELGDVATGIDGNERRPPGRVDRFGKLLEQKP